MTLSRFALTLVIGLSSGMLTYLMAAGMSLIISGMGIINFGQGAFYVLGAYVCNQIFTAMGLPFGLALLGGFVVTALLGGVLERLLRPVFGKDMIFSLLITMGASYIICDSMIMVWGNKVKATGLPKFLSGAVMIPFTKIVFPYYYLFIIAIAALVGIAFAVLFKKPCWVCASGPLSTTRAWLSIWASTWIACILSCLCWASVWVVWRVHSMHRFPV